GSIGFLAARLHRALPDADGPRGPPDRLPLVQRGVARPRGAPDARRRTDHHQGTIPLGHAQLSFARGSSAGAAILARDAASTDPRPAHGRCAHRGAARVPRVASQRRAPGRLRAAHRDLRRAQPRRIGRVSDLGGEMIQAPQIVTLRRNPSRGVIPWVLAENVAIVGSAAAADVVLKYAGIATGLRVALAIGVAVVTVVVILVLIEP